MITTNTPQSTTSRELELTVIALELASNLRLVMASAAQARDLIESDEDEVSDEDLADMLDAIATIDDEGMLPLASEFLNSPDVDLAVGVREALAAVKAMVPDSFFEGANEGGISFDHPVFGGAGTEYDTELMVFVVG